MVPDARFRTLVSTSQRVVDRRLQDAADELGQSVLGRVAWYPDTDLGSPEAR